MAIWSAIKTDWNNFETWVASWMPGFKTMIVTGLGAVGSFAGALQEYITGIPLSQFMTGTQVLIVTSALFTLAFWLRGIGDRASLTPPNPPVVI